MRRFEIGRYKYQVSPLVGYNMNSISRPSKLNNTIENYDNLLYESLDKIFRERCHSNTDLVKEFLRGSQLKSIIEPILKQEPILSKHFSKEDLAELSLLWIAVLGSYEDSAELLVRSGADVNEFFGFHEPQVIDKNWTVLHVLLQTDPTPENERLTRMVIMDYGVDFEYPDYMFKTVLHYAIAKDRVRMTEMLLEKGADVNAADSDGMTPLLAAANKYKATKLLPLLMKYGADVFAKSRCGRNVLHHMAHFSFNDSRPVKLAELASVFIKKGVLFDDKENFDHQQPIHDAAVNRKIELVKCYLDHGADVNALTKSDISPLHFAARTGNHALVEILLERGSNIALRTLRGRTALHDACEHAAETSADEDGDLENIIRLLLTAGADVLAEDSNGETPLALISSQNDGDQPGEKSWPLIEALALKKSLQPSIKLKDEEIVKRYPTMKYHFQKCLEEIHRMKSTKLIGICTFVDLLTKSQCRIATLMQNPEFETQFKLYDLNAMFSIYAVDILRAYERAQDHYRAVLELTNMINEAFYNRLPYLIVKKVVQYIFGCAANE